MKRIAKLLLVWSVVILLTACRNSVSGGQEALTQTADLPCSTVESAEELTKAESQSDVSQKDEAENAYDTWNEFPYETMMCIDDEVFEQLQKQYSELTWQPEFKQVKITEVYLRKYQELLDNEITFYDRETDKEYYLREFTRGNGRDDSLKDMDYSQYRFSIFDMNSDDKPELLVRNQAYFILVFGYDENIDQTYLWNAFYGSWLDIVGSNVVDNGGNGGLSHHYLQYDKEGNAVMSAWFYSGVFWTGNMVYMVSCIYDYDAYGNPIRREMPVEMERQGYFDSRREVQFYPVTEEQYHKLAGSYLDLKNNVAQQYHDMEQTYEEMFGADKAGK